MDTNILIGQVVMVNRVPQTEDTNAAEILGKKAVVRMLYDADPTDPDAIDEAQIEWTAEALDSFSEDYFYDSYEQEVSSTSSLLPLDCLTPTEEVHDENARLWKIQEIFTRLYLPGLGRASRLIASVFDKPVDPAVKTPYDCWAEYLRKNLRFPVKCKACYPYEEGDGPLREGERLTLTAINSVDPAMGVMAEVNRDGHDFIVPLMDLTAGDGYSKDGKYIEAYGIWQACSA